MQGTLTMDGLFDTLAPRQTPPSASHLVAHSPGMRKLAALVDAIGPSDCSVLIAGETGTGKERVARALHAGSRRAHRRLAAMHCAAIPATLLERELFGHERGAFTGADRRKKGAFEAADGSTFLLDEIGELEPHLQVKLLRVLQEREVVCLGSTEPIRVDVRVIATTNRDLRAEVERHTFRADLFYRLNTVELHVPPLRERREDVLALCEELLAEAAAPDEPPRQFSPAAARVLLAYSWPGNVRELQSAVERACLLCRGPRIEPMHLPPELLGTVQRPAEPAARLSPPGPWPAAEPAQALPDFREARRRFERDYFLSALAAAGGNISAAARGAGLSWKHFRAKMRDLNIRAGAWNTVGPGLARS